ncbi:MAG: sulfotransferase family protein [Actinomycetota bacterium]
MGDSEPAAGAVANALIAGVNKAGTTSLFVTLAGHPDIAPASVKETRYFLPARWGQPLEARAVYERYWADAGDAPVRLEATPAYFAGGPSLVRAVREVCGDAKILVVLREPVARLVSYFTFQQARLRIPGTMTLTEYLARADALTDADFRDPANEVYFGARGGAYADYLPDWTAEFGADVRVLFFEDLVGTPRDTVAAAARFLGVDPARLPGDGLSSENRTTGFRNPRLQRVALGFNDRFEPFLRRHHGLKRRLRAAYLRVNGRALPVAVTDGERAALGARYVEANARLVDQLRAMEVGVLPDWLSTEARSTS